MSETMNGRTVGTIDLSGTTLKYDGDQASKGSITFTDGKPEAKMYISGYCVEVAVNGKVTSEKKAEDECEVTTTPSEPTTYTKYNNGAELLYNPVNNVKCEAATSSATGTNDTCMKWYAFLDSEDSSTVNLILDHNTTGKVAWNASRGTTPDTVNAKLQTDVTNWTGEAKSSARLISASEVNQIAPTNPNWSVSDYNTWYYLHTGLTGSSNKYEGAAGSNTYAWLFDNTSGCTTYGCNVADNGTDGYWTSSYAAGGTAWLVGYSGRLDRNDVDSDDIRGVRPVITISKSIFY